MALSQIDVARVDAIEAGLLAYELYEPTSEELQASSSMPAPFTRRLLFYGRDAF